jgi:membrane-associated phospholipid phosphatase
MNNRQPTTENRSTRSRPARTPRRWRIGLAVGVLLLPGAVLGDRVLLAALRPDAGSWIVGVMQWGTWLGYGLVDIAVPLAIVLVAWRRGDRETARRGVLGALAVTAAGLLGQVAKNLLCRARPNADAPGVFFSGFPCFPASYALASFPSGHATTAFALATLLSLWYPRWTAVWLVIAIGVGWSRIVLGSHFPSDVLGGAVLGVAVVLVMQRWVSGPGKWKTDNRQPTTGQ